MHFTSKKDIWITVVVWGTVIVCAIPFFIERNIPSLIVAIVFALGLGWMWFKTGYEVKDNTLIIHSGFHKVKIPVTAIYKLRKTNNPISSPALSLDRIEVLYSPNMGMAIISPKERAAFIELLLSINPEIRVDEKLLK